MKPRRCPSYPGYSVTNDGRVYSHHTHRPPYGIDYTVAEELTGGIDPKGYRSFCLKVGPRRFRSVRLHLLLMDAFVRPRPRGLHTRHLDGNPANNDLSNLRYGTFARTRSAASSMMAAGLQDQVPTHHPLRLRHVEYQRVISPNSDGTLVLLQATREINGAAVWQSTLDRELNEWGEPELVEFRLQAEDALETAVGLYQKARSVAVQLDGNGLSRAGRRALLKRDRGGD